MIFKNKCFVFLLIASSFRFFGGYSLGFWASTYFGGVYPEYSDAYSITNAVVVIVGGSSSSYMGGYISDKFEPRIPPIKGYVSAIGALCSVPFIILTFSFNFNFYVAMFCYFLAYLTAEVWYGPCYA